MTLLCHTGTYIVLQIGCYFLYKAKNPLIEQFKISKVLNLKKNNIINRKILATLALGGGLPNLVIICEEIHKIDRHHAPHLGSGESVFLNESFICEVPF